MVQCLFYSATCLWNYCNVYFRELGFNGQEIGFMSATGTFLTMVLLPLLGILGDKLRSPRTVFLWLTRILFPLYLLIPLFGMLWGASLVPFMVLVPMILFVVAASTTMMDSWSGSELESTGAPYGSIRWCGSFGAVIVGLTASVVVGPILPAWSCCVVIPVIGMVLFIHTGRKRVETAPERVKQEKTMSGKKLLGLVFKNYYFVVYLLLHLGFGTFCLPSTSACLI